MKQDPHYESDAGEDAGAAHVRRIVTEFLGAKADIEEVRAMLRAWIRDVRRSQMPPEQALLRFKALLPTTSRFADRREPDTRDAAELISLFIREYYAGERAANEDVNP